MLSGGVVVGGGCFVIYDSERGDGKEADVGSVDDDDDGGGEFNLRAMIRVVSSNKTFTNYKRIEGRDR